MAKICWLLAALTVVAYSIPMSDAAPQFAFITDLFESMFGSQRPRRRQNPSTTSTTGPTTAPTTAAAASTDASTTAAASSTSSSTSTIITEDPSSNFLMFVGRPHVDTRYWHDFDVDGYGRHG